MSELTPALEAELRTDSPTIFGAVAIDLPEYQVNLLDGAGVLTFGGRTYLGEDVAFGVLSDIENLTDGVGDQAPAIGITLLPSSDASAAVLSGPTMQGSPVTVMLGAVNPITGVVIPDPHLLFIGELDVSTIQSGEQGRRLELEVVSVFERLFEDDESARLSPGFHKSIFPGELGLDFVTGVAEPVYWGMAGPNSGIVTGGSGGGSGGGGMFGALFGANAFV